MKQTQCQAILQYLRRHKRATNMELVTNLRIASPWRRIREMQDAYGLSKNWPAFAWNGQVSDSRRITRTFIKTPSGKRVVQYRLERV